MTGSKKSMFLPGCVPFREEDRERYTRLGAWRGLTFGDILDRAADLYPDKEALVDNRSRLTYSQVRDNADRLAISFMGLGIEEQDRVLIQLPNWNEFVYSYFALQKIGAIPVLLIDRYRQHEINHLIRLTDAKAWLVPERYGKTDYLPIVDDVLKDNPAMKEVIFVRGTGRHPPVPLEEMMGPATLSEKDLARLAERRPDPAQVAHMGPTGGTTGLPKVAPRTHNDSLCGAEYAARAWELDRNDICLAAGPVGHDLTFHKGVCGVMMTCGKLVMLDTVEPERICRAIEGEKVTAVVWVPALASRLMDFKGLKDYDLSSLKKMHCGGGKSLPDLIKRVTEKIGCTYFNAYGGTEGMSTMTRMNDDFEKVCRTVGKPTCPYDIYKVVGQDGEVLPPNTPGELLVKGPGIFTGYYRAPGENKKVIDEEGFFRTGDLAMIDGSGYLTLTGRIKEMINRGGESISAVEIETLISDCPDIVFVAVVPMPDPEMGERVCAYIQPRPGADLSFEKMISFLKDRKASVLQFPERIEIVDAMPFTKAGKVDKKALQKDIEMKLGRGMG